MSNQIKTIGVKVPLEFYEKIKMHANSHSISISDFIRDAMEGRLNGGQQSSNEVKPAFDALTGQLQIKDEQIEHLHQLLAMKEKAAMEQTLMLEDMRNRSLWRRVKMVFAPAQ